MKGVSVIEGLNVGEFILNNYVLILSGIALVIFTAMDVTTLTKVKHIVRIEVILTFFLAVFDYIDLTLAKSDVFYSIRLYSAIICYILRPALFVPIIVLFTSKKLGKAIPILVVVVNGLTYISALFSPIAFCINEKNEWIPGTLSKTALISSVFLCIYWISTTLIHFQTKDRQEILLIIVTSITSTLAGFLESIYMVRILNLSIMMSIILSYLFIHLQYSRRDALTNLQNRHFYYDFCKRKANSVSAVISMDMNELKWINDNKGHAAGDEAIKIVAAIFMKNQQRRIYSFRVGGDEFVEMCEDEVKQHIKEIRRDLWKTQYSCAIGYAMCNKEQSLSQTSKIADYNMYQDKKKIKNQIIVSGEKVHFRE